MISFRRLAFTAVATAVPASLVAQPPRMGQPRPPEKDAAHVMVTTFKAVATENALKEKGVGYQASDEMRKKIDGAFPPKQIWVIPVESINPNLTASAFSTTDALEAHDAKQLATALRADEYIAGTATKSATGYRVEADLVLPRDINARQPLGVGEAPKLGDALNILVKEYKEARKQLDGEKKCVRSVSEQKYPDALAAANLAITAYPKSTLARACLLNALYLSKAPTDEVVKVAKELTALDPRSNVALRFVADAYRKGGAAMSDSLVLTLLQMMRNDPRNAELQLSAITEIADAKNPGIARPIIDSAIVLNQGDPDLLRLRWRILGAMKDWKEMFAQGTELVRLDTSFADTTYFTRTANAYATDSAWQKAASIAAEGVKKFPSNAFLVGYEIQMLQKAGQPQQALEKLDKASAAKVPVPNSGTQKLLLLQELNKTDEIFPAARQLIAAGDTSENVRLVLIKQAGDKFSASQKLIPTDAAAAEAGFISALQILAYADSVAKPSQKPQIAFLRGASSAFMANMKYQAAAPAKSCEMAKAGKGYVTDAMINLPQGGASAAKATMDQLMGMAMQIDTQLDVQIKTFACK